MGHFHRNESAAHEWSICSLFHLIKPLISDFLSSSHRDRNTFKQLMSGHCFVLSLSSNLHQVWTQPFACLVRLVCRLSRVWQRNSQGSRRQGSKENTQEDRPQYAVVSLSGPSCSTVSSPPVTNGLIDAAVACARLLAASSVSSDSITFVSTPPVCAAVDLRQDSVLLDVVELAAPPGLWPRLGPPLLRSLIPAVAFDLPSN